MRSNQKGFGFTGILILIVIVVVGATGLYLSKNRKEATKFNKTPASIEEIITTIKNEVSTNPELKEVGAAEGSYNGYVHFKTADYNFMSTVESKNLVNYQPKDPQYLKVQNESEEGSARQKDIQTLESTKKTIIETVTSNDFQEVEDYPVSEMFGEGKMYAREHDVCAVNTGVTVGIACATKKSLSEAAREVKPFVQIYERSMGNSESGLSFGLIEYGTGTTVNDKYAIVSIGPGAAHFYEKNGAWLYYATSSEGIGCEETPKNIDAANAFSKICRSYEDGF